MRVGRHRPVATARSAGSGQKAGPRPVMRQPAVRELGRLRRPRRRLRAGLVQLLCVLAGLGLGLLLPRISTGPSVASTRVTEALVTIGFGTLGLVRHLLAALPGRAVGLREPFAPAEPGAPVRSGRKRCWLSSMTSMAVSSITSRRLPPPTATTAVRALRRAGTGADRLAVDRARVGSKDGLRPRDPLARRPVTDLQIRIAAAMRELRRRGHPVNRP